MSVPVAIKGSKDGLRLVLDEHLPWDDVLRALRDQLGRGTDFFNGATITIDTGDRPLGDTEFDTLLASTLR